MAFPHIKHTSDLLPFVKDNTQIRVKVETNGFTVVCYMVQDEDTFTGENAEFSRECRGITFAPDGKISARTMHKFFNVGQVESTKPENIIWEHVVRIMDKRDGSMVTPVLIDPDTRQWHMKTKKSFDTKEAVFATHLALTKYNANSWILDMFEKGLTPIFEITTPKMPIVLIYKADELTLLHVRENETGRYLTENELQRLQSPFPIVKNIIDDFTGVTNTGDEGEPTEFGVRWDMLESAAKTAEDIEGWVIQFRDGDMVKLKTEWYCNLHRAVTFTRWRDIAVAVVEDSSDDLKAAFAMTGRSIEPILFVEREIKNKISAAEQHAELIANEGVRLKRDAKSLAIEYKADPVFTQIMRIFRGQDVNWMEWYEKRQLDNDWSLEVVQK